MGFTVVQTMTPAGVISGTTIKASFTSNPTPHNVICISVFGVFAADLLSVVDDNGNFYTITPNSPSAVNDATAGSVWLAYILDAPASANKNLTANFNIPPAFGIIHAMEFNPSSTPTFFDKDADGNGSGGATVNTPSITPTFTGELLWAGVAEEIAALSADSPWTADAAHDVNGGMAEYILSSASGSTAVGFTQSPGHWDSMAMAISLTNPVVNVAGDDSQQITVIQQADNVISIW